ncbi:MAG: malonic semialdehyde reductase [Alphaproteobacteria bacterium]|nr:malonic semialdehyde reductase [Alphaproteobacteria bacterium]MBV9420502.1 malonic semialdehyde reductase [Alphaproteobacteria bacterium]MBV9541278.1 malonic semialdehyde reductase [Alphaproteobacteria bacterium]MBV9905677.1 malonic semialdehyde reductase [Alphaproteobacteria bacterium]
MDHHAVNDEALDTIFRAARTQNKWQDKPVSTAHLMAVYDLMRWGPTSANCSPARFLFLTTPEAKQRLAQHASPGNKPKVLSAPVTAIIGYDLDFAQKLPQLFPHDQTAKTWFTDPLVEHTTAFRNGTLQGAYFIIAARALGLDCGPMSGFNNAKVDEEFFAGTRVKSNFICGVGYGDPAGLFARSPRLSFDEACKIL